MDCRQVGNFINVALMSMSSPTSCCKIAANSVVTIAVVLYDYILTFRQEVDVIWCYGSKGKNAIAASMLFLGNRYLAILYGVVGFISGTVALVCIFCKQLDRN